ncbi:hypothetical protein H8S95_17745 [Pontibacter sp. KCTC 32443]|uniref:Cthe_2314 family HEPN domain-containing protein n=1 Tax=Pontibacter TaxID=323449 RepID=UPI00164E83BA|nr:MULTISPECIES: Cthe_2314 family HEPN domain-containing protein [Pontibacter]MBC5775923.1 hypothetical protein [Pontibacter sp. KCTC 32443]
MTNLEKEYEPFLYPAKEERIEILKSQPLLSKLYLTTNDSVKSVNTSEDFIKENDFTVWRNRFNNKVRRLEFSYVLLRFYYSRGIPDTNWAENTDDGSTEFFPFLKDKAIRTNKFLFDYSVENFFYHYVSAADIVYHLLNVYYKLAIVSGTKFNKKVLDKLKGRDVAKVLEHFENTIRSFRKDRNDFAHNFSFNEIDLRSKREIKEGREVITICSYYFSTSSQTLIRIEDSIVHFSELIDLINKELSK